MEGCPTQSRNQNCAPKRNQRASGMDSNEFKDCSLDSPQVSVASRLPLKSHTPRLVQESLGESKRAQVGAKSETRRDEEEPVPVDLASHRPCVLSTYPNTRFSLLRNLLPIRVPWPPLISLHLDFLLLFSPHAPSFPQLLFSLCWGPDKPCGRARVFFLPSACAQSNGSHRVACQAAQHFCVTRGGVLCSLRG